MTDLTLNSVEIAHLFRLSRHIEAGLLLADLFEQLIDVTDVNTTDLESAIKSILTCQERRDWLGLADYLEFELVHIMGGNVSHAA